MFLTIEKTRPLNGKKTKAKIAFKDLTTAMNYVTNWIKQYEPANGVGLVSWSKKIKIGFWTTTEDGTEHEIAIEEIDELP